MSIGDVKAALMNAHHAVGQAYTYVNNDCRSAAMMSVRDAREALRQAYDGLDKIQN